MPVGQYFLPPAKFCSLEFMREVLSGKKRVFHRCDVIHYQVPRYRELSIKRILAMVIKEPEML